ncbi:MAG: cobalamin biosynthesis protein, partial [Candidatus Adiutrix sp.]|nr:cobalamin biosynthesis protein [Candidatus Adiutrix sp.]
MTAFLTLLAFIGDWILGDPQRWPHPVRAIGRLISFAEAEIRRKLGPDPSPERLRLGGACLAVGTVLTVMAVTALILALGTVWPFL